MSKQANSAKILSDKKANSKDSLAVLPCHKKDNNEYGSIKINHSFILSFLFKLPQPILPYLNRYKIADVKNTCIALSLLCCLFLPATITYLGLTYQKKQIKREVKHKIIAQIDKTELTLLKFTEQQKQTDLRWEHSKEFEYQGEMYDIVTTEYHQDTTYYWCWPDHEETKLNKQLAQLTALALAHNTRHQESQAQFFKFFKSLFCSESTHIAFKPELILFQNNDSPTFCIAHFYARNGQSPPTPPPEIA